MFFKRSLVGFSIVISITAFAQDFPKGCVPQDYQFSEYNLVLNDVGEQRLFLMQNKSTEAIELGRKQGRDDFMSPSLSAKLNPGTWAAFASDMTHLYFECHVTEGENTRKINCGQVLDVCEYPRAKFALSNMGNYWVSANKPRQAIIQDAANKGIYLRW